MNIKQMAQQAKKGTWYFYTCSEYTETIKHFTLSSFISNNVSKQLKTASS